MLAGDVVPMHFLVLPPETSLWTTWQCQIRFLAGAVAENILAACVVGIWGEQKLMMMPTRGTRVQASHNGGLARLGQVNVNALSWLREAQYECPHITPIIQIYSTCQWLVINIMKHSGSCQNNHVATWPRNRGQIYKFFWHYIARLWSGLSCSDLSKIVICQHPEVPWGCTSNFVGFVAHFLAKHYTLADTCFLT